jgi:hypothetical protein
MTSSLLEEEEAARIAGEITERYGTDALDYVRARAERARSVGDDLACGCWESVEAVLAASATL